MSYYIFILSLILVYLILAGQYENWVTPAAILLSVPLALLGTVFALSALGLANNMYTQIGILLLIVNQEVAAEKIAGSGLLWLGDANYLSFSEPEDRIGWLPFSENTRNIVNSEFHIKNARFSSSNFIVTGKSACEVWYK